MTKVIHIFDGSFEGLLTSVFDAHARRRFPDGVYTTEEYQESFCEIPELVETDYAKANRVLAGIEKKLGAFAYGYVWTAYLSCDPERYSKISRYLRLCFASGRDMSDRLAEPAALDMLAINRNVGRETNKLLGFLRFSVMENGVQFAQITPVHNQIPLLMQHFADRLQDIPFVIYDTGRRIAGIYDAKQWYIADARGFAPPRPAPDEEDVKALWKIFYNSIAIESRRNPKLQSSLMPKRYWRNMTEHM